MGLARIAIAVIAVVVAFALLIIGGIALWGALTSKDGEKPNATSPTPSSASSATKSKAPPAGQVDNTIVVHCLATQCPLFVSGPTAADVQFNGNLGQNERRIFTGSHLTAAVQDASTVTVTINGKLQPRGGRGEAKNYEVPSPQ
jgi:hypothetical protein